MRCVVAVDYMIISQCSSMINNKVSGRQMTANDVKHEDDSPVWDASHMDT